METDPSDSDCVACCDRIRSQIITAVMSGATALGAVFVAHIPDLPALVVVTAYIVALLSAADTAWTARRIVWPEACGHAALDRRGRSDR